jgi:hypothetical protein
VLVYRNGSLRTYFEPHPFHDMVGVLLANVTWSLSCSPRPSAGSCARAGRWALVAALIVLGYPPGITTTAFGRWSVRLRTSQHEVLPEAGDGLARVALLLDVEPLRLR